MKERVRRALAELARVVARWPHLRTPRAQERLERALEDGEMTKPTKDEEGERHGR